MSFQSLVQQRHQLPLPVVAALLDERQRRPGALQLSAVCRREQRLDVDSVLGAPFGVVGEDLQREEMTDARERCDESGKDLGLLGLRDHLGLDAGRREEEVHDGSFVPVRFRPKARGGEAPHRFLLDEREHLVPRRAERPNDVLRGWVVRHGHHDVYITRESRLDARRNSQPASERPRTPSPAKQ